LNFGVESGLSSVHFTFAQLAFHFILFFGWWGVGFVRESKEFPSF
jgi:hypothetical protein